MSRSLPARVLLLAAAATVVVCHLRPRPEAHAEASAPAFDPGTVRPAPGSPLAEARAALDEERWADARRLAERALRGASVEDRGRLLWVAADAARGAGDAAGELLHLGTLAASVHPLARWARLRRASALEATDPVRAAAEAAPLTADAWPGRWKARVVEARALAATGDAEAAIPKLRALVEETPSHVGAATPGMPLAALLAARPDDASREEALHLYRRVATRAPAAAVGREAEAAAARVLEALPEPRRSELTPLSLDDRWARAAALYGARSYADAERELAALATELAADPAKRCQALLMQGRALLGRRERDAGAAHMARVASECADPEVKAAARYNAGRAHAARERWAEAIAEYEALEREAPASRLADDALFRAALTERAAGNAAGLIARLSALPERYPRGDMVPEARFRLAWERRAAGEHAAALAELDRLLREGPGEDAEDIVGRAAYWRARTLADLRRDAESIDQYERLVRRWPLSYYAQQALTRLDAAAPARAEALRAELRDDGRRVALLFPRRAEMDTPAFARALELLRVGAIDEAEQELRALGALGEGADPDLLWLAAALLDHAGAHPTAHRLVRQRLASYRSVPPVGRGRALWRIAYPKAYAPLIEEAAAAQGMPPAFVRAVAREESAFDPDAVSGANAYGLIQILLPTARRFGSRVGVSVTRANIREPAVNLAAGTSFMAWLHERYRPNPAVLPAAYNAGHASLDRWLRADGSRPLDAFVEEIPYDETRRYTRRVLQSYGVYSWLDGGTLPPLAPALPPAP